MASTVVLVTIPDTNMEGIAAALADRVTRPYGSKAQTPQETVAAAVSEFITMELRRYNQRQAITAANTQTTTQAAEIKASADTVDDPAPVVTSLATEAAKVKEKNKDKTK